MALHGSGGAYYKGNATIPSSVGLHSAYSRHVWVRGASVPSTANFRYVGGLVGSGQNPGDQLIWNHTSGSYNKSNIHRSGGGAYISSRYVSSLPANTWLGLGVTFNGTTLVSYLDGVADATVGGSAAATANAVEVQLLAAMVFGGGLDSSSNWTDGEVAEYAYWNTALSADEMASLAKGFRADRIRPQALQFYAPCVRDLQDIRGGRTLVKQAGTDVPSDHPRVF